VTYSKLITSSNKHMSSEKIRLSDVAA